MSAKPIRVSLHLGPMKTGSTTLQFAFDQGRETLLRAGFHYPVGICFPEAQHELPNWMAGTLQRFAYSNSPVDPSIDGLRRHVASVVADARILGAHTLVLSSEDFSALDEGAWSGLVGILREAGAGEIRLVWSSFDPEERLRSYVNQYVRQGEHVSSADIPVIREQIAESLAATKRGVVGLARSGAVDVIELHYSKRPGYMSDLVSAVTSPEVAGALQAGEYRSLNISTSKVDMRLINTFNRLNVKGRPFDPESPITFSDAYPRERRRLIMVREGVPMWRSRLRRGWDRVRFVRTRGLP